MKKTLFGFIWHFSWKQQVVILVITVFSFPLVYMSLEVPKWIVNNAIQGKNFPQTFLGMQFEQIPYLVLLCMIFLALVVANNVIKYVLNLYKGIVGERMLRRLRHQLYFQILRFRPGHFRKVSSGELIPMITAEVEDLGGFIGDAVAVPAFQGGTLLVYLFFIFVQDPMLGFAAISLYPVQAYIIPRLQRRVIILSRDRIKNVRRISDRIGESVGGTIDVHANDTSAWHLANISDRLFENYNIRFEIYKRKYMIKFVNNFMNQLPPFLFYLIGGILVIQGSISFGALVAVLAAYKDLASPWKELLDYYQNMSNVQVKYETIVENFDPTEIYPPERLLADPEAGTALAGALVLSHVVGGSNPAKPEVQDVSIDVPEGGHIGLIGGDGSGRGELLQITAGLVSAISGKVEIGGRSIDGLPESVLGRQVAYVGPTPHVFNETIRSNVIYGLRHRPMGPPDLPEAEAKKRSLEAAATDSTLFDFLSPWEDLSAAGVETVAELDTLVMEVLADVGLGDDVYHMGLQARIDPAEDGDLVERVLSARRAIVERVSGNADVADLVELWNPAKLNLSATIAENVLFALPTDPATPLAAIPSDPMVMAFLTEAGLADDLVSLGASVAETMIELFSTMRGDDSLVGSYSFVAMDELPAYEARLKRMKSTGASGLSAADKAAFIGLAFRIVPARHRIAEIGPDLAQKIVDGRPLFRKHLDDGSGRYVPFDPEVYIGSLTLEDNLLFGKVRVDRRGARDRIDAFVRDTVAELGLRQPVARAGLEFQVGVAGSRLTTGQRRRIGVARALVKRPSLAVFDDCIDDPSTLAAVRRRLEGRTAVFGASQPFALRGLDSYYVLRFGRLVAEGAYDTVVAAFEDEPAPPPDRDDAREEREVEA
jgi:putative ABC transport system ATP-binding protein